MTYYDLGAYTRPITTKSPEAQVWFDRGLNWLFGFNHDEAISLLRQGAGTSIQAAPWRIGASPTPPGPNYNPPWHLYDPAGKARALAAAYDAMQAALACARSGDAGRAGADPGAAGALPAARADRGPVGLGHGLHQWHAQGVQGESATISTFAAVFVEAIMNETPWQMWDLSHRRRRRGAGTAEAVEVLEEAPSATSGRRGIIQACCISMFT